MQELGEQFSQVAKKLWQRDDLYVIGPYYYLERHYNHPKTKGLILIAPQSYIQNLDRMHQFETDLVELLEPDIYHPTNKHAAYSLGRLEFTWEGESGVVYPYPSDYLIELALMIAIAACLPQKRISDMNYTGRNRLIQSQLTLFANRASTQSTLRSLKAGLT